MVLITNQRRFHIVIDRRPGLRLHLSRYPCKGGNVGLEDTSSTIVKQSQTRGRRMSTEVSACASGPGGPAQRRGNAETTYTSRYAPQFHGDIFNKYVRVRSSEVDEAEVGFLRERLGPLATKELAWEAMTPEFQKRIPGFLELNIAAKNN